MTKDIQETITQFVTEILLQRGITAKPSPDTSLIDSGLIDSLSVVTFVGQLEVAFDITISMADMTLDNFDNIQLICELVRSKRAEV
jgi:acyl carrier protein